MHQSISPGKSRHLISIHVHRYTTTELPFLVNIKWNDKKMTKQKVQRPMKNRTTLRILCSHLTIESCNNFIQLLQRQKKREYFDQEKTLSYREWALNQSFISYYGIKLLEKEMYTNSYLSISNRSIESQPQNGMKNVPIKNNRRYF